MKLFIFILFLLQEWMFCSGARKLNIKDTLVFGPGLNPDIVLPVRYFIIQAVDTKGRNYTHSPGKNAFDFAFSSRDDDRVRAWRNILDRNDGTFIMRFRLYRSYEDLSIEVRHNGKHVAESPYVLKGIAYHETCNCPEHDRSKWNDFMSCSPSYQQIDNGFETFPKVDLNFTEGIKRFNRLGVFCHYSIIANKIYRKCYGEHVGFARFGDDWFLSLSRKVCLPNIEFLLNIGDWPLSKKGYAPVPILSWCGSEDTFDLVIPTYDLTKSTLDALGKSSLDMMSVQGDTGPRWKSKIAKGLFRGRDSRQERLDLTVLGRSKPELFDVALTNFFFFKHDEKKYGPKNQHMPFSDFFKYKYQLNIDGTVAAYRLPYLLVGDALVFKQDSPYFEHFYHELEPWKHYIPFNRDLSNIEERLLWAKSNDAEARRIGLAGQLYARNNLMSDNLYCYTLTIFQEYAKRQIQKPRRHEGMEYIAQPNGDDTKCTCKRKRKKKNKKNVKSEL